VRKSSLTLLLVAITVVAVAAAWFWALDPITTALLYITPSGWTDADLVRHLWLFRLVQPEWASGPPQYDYLRWVQAETTARLGSVFLAWISCAAWIMRRHLRSPNIALPNWVATMVASLALKPQTGSEPSRSGAAIEHLDACEPGHGGYIA